MEAHGVLVRRLDSLDLLEVERLHTFLGIRLETVLDVGGGELAPIERRHVLPLHALPQLEGPDAIVGTRRPRLCEVALEPHVDGAARLVGKYIADEAVAGEA